MSEYEKTLQEETVYLTQTIDLINKVIAHETGELLESRRKQFLTSRREMWEDTNPSSPDFDRIIETSQYLAAINQDTLGYLHTTKRLDRYQRLISSPYFGRVDFTEDDYPERERLYIGYCSIIDPDTREVCVYDWRAPVSSLFYSGESSRAAYSSPAGQILGTIHLKRQFKIVDSKLKYYFDSAVRITDEILQEVLSRTSSSKMRTIVETIQREQDLIIRDTDSGLLLVQGMAGSGKTSVALHRIAFLLYEGLMSKLSSEHVLIISPNELFSSYIYGVLPELGEENVTQLTFDEISSTLLSEDIALETRNEQLEALLLGKPSGTLFRREGACFKGSKSFHTILNRLLRHYAHQVIPFQDVSFESKVLEKREILKSRFLHNPTAIPMAKQLLKLEKTILEEIHPLRKKRLGKLMNIVERSEGHELEIKTFSRYLSLIEAKQFVRRLHQFTRIHYLEIYRLLFRQEGLLRFLAQGLELPENINGIIAETNAALTAGQAYYEDCAPLLYLKTRVEGIRSYSRIRHAVIDEAQDYSPLQYEVFNLLFPNARFTVLGDVNQSLEKNIDDTLYDQISSILRKPKTSKVLLSTGYRSTKEINAFAREILGKDEQFSLFDRCGEQPSIRPAANTGEKTRAIILDIRDYVSKGLSVAVLCKTMRDAEKAYSQLNEISGIRLIGPQEEELGTGPLILPSYLAKGLEFDAVIIYNADKETYQSETDRQILYVACTRALHILRVYYTGEGSPFLPPHSAGGFSSFRDL